MIDIDKILKFAMVVVMTDQNTENNTLETTPSTPTRYKFKYINRASCKRFALDFAAVNRSANKFGRVSEEFLISCEIALKNHIQSRIRSHPSIGKTLK